MKAQYWIEARVEVGEIAETDNYLDSIQVWHSWDGENWIREPDRYELYTGGTREPIIIADSIEAVTAKCAWDGADALIAALIDKIDYGAEWTSWMVDSAGIIREWTAEVLPVEEEWE